MNRKDKIELLRRIADGHSTIGELLPPIVRIWVQDASDPDLLHSKADGLTKRKDEKFRDETTGRKVINILISRINNLSLVGDKRRDLL